ncbi:MAG: gliding motility protein GldN [Bacteroidia bacterium]
MKKINLLVVIVVASAVCGYAQQPVTTTTTSNTPPTQKPSSSSSSVLGPGSGVNNNIFIPEHLPNRKPIPYVYEREADIMWSKRIWRVIDLREKINHPLYYPGKENTQKPSLFAVIQKGIATGELSVYDPNPAVFTPDQEFQIEYTPTQAQKSYIHEVTINVQDTTTGELIPTSKPDTFFCEDIKQYWLKEDWYFEKQRSVMDVRILGIAPVVEKVDEKGEFKAYQVLFWLYYPGCRNYFAKFQCYNPYNDAEWRTYDEIFHKRLFSSFVKQESNVYNRIIGSYAHNMDALLESERIKDDIFKFEHDMWHL